MQKHCWAKFCNIKLQRYFTKQAQVISIDNIDTSCCSDGKSLCYQDLSKLCKNLAILTELLNGTKRLGNTNVCSVYLSTQLRQFAQLNLTLNDDSNTCDDYIVEKGDEWQTIYCAGYMIIANVADLAAQQKWVL